MLHLDNHQVYFFSCQFWCHLPVTVHKLKVENFVLWATDLKSMWRWINFWQDQSIIRRLMVDGTYLMFRFSCNVILRFSFKIKHHKLIDRLHQIIYQGTLESKNVFQGTNLCIFVLVFTLLDEAGLFVLFTICLSLSLCILLLNDLKVSTTGFEPRSCVAESNYSTNCATSNT